MPIVRTILMEAARRIASNPELRARAVNVAQQEVLPRAKTAARRAGEETLRQRDLLRADMEAARERAGEQASNAEVAGRLLRRVAKRVRDGE